MQLSWVSKILAIGLLIAVSISCEQPTEPETIGPVWSELGSKGFSSGEIREPHIAFSSGDVPYVGYIESENTIRVQRYNGEAWQDAAPTITGSWNVRHLELEIDDSGRVVIAYTDPSNSARPTVARLESGSWNIIGSGPVQDVEASDMAVAVHGTDTVFVAFEESNSSSHLNVFKWGGSSWDRIGNQDYPANAVISLQLDVDPAGTPYVCFQDGVYATQGFTVAKFDGMAWSALGNYENPYDSGVSELDFKIDSNGTPFTAFRHHASAGRISVMKFDGTSWSHVGSPGFSEDYVYNSKIAFSTDNTPYTACRDGVGGKYLAVRKFTNDSWERVGDSSTVQNYPFDMAFDINGAGVPYLLFDDTTEDRYASVIRFE